MSQTLPPDDGALPAAPSWLERLTAGVLLLVIAAVAWMVCVAWQPDWLRLRSGNLPTWVFGAAALLAGALIWWFNQ